MNRMMVLIAAGLILAGCGANAEQQATTEQATAEATQELPAGHPSVGDAEAGAPGSSLAGTVVETMNSGGYTYMRIAKDGGEEWVAVPLTEVETGQDVLVTVQMTMADFESTSLNRTFESIIFGTMGGQAASPHGGAMGMGDAAIPPEMAAGMAGKNAADIGDVNVDKAEGPDARTVAELWAQRTDLVDRTIVVRGKVVKFSPAIMGRNWVHLRDGSGAAEDGTNDITVTTDAMVAVGDVVVAKGIVRIDKDLGMGYNYPVIIEDGKFEK